MTSVLSKVDPYFDDDLTRIEPRNQLIVLSRRLKAAGIFERYVIMCCTDGRHLPRDDAERAR
jgi:hypothetical protein